MSRLESLIAISVSDPPDNELEARGVLPEHLRHAFVEIARQILAAGGSLAYGGDLRRQGYARTLIALLQTYSRADRPARDRVRQYLAHPSGSGMTDDDLADVALVATPVLVPTVAAPGDPDAVAEAKDFAAMRVKMTEECDARIVVGGRLAGQKGRWPGIVEEAQLALAGRRPLFVVGGLGGAAARVADALQGEWPQELTTAYQLDNGSAGYDEVVAADVGAGEDELRRSLQSAELENGLSPEDNALLMRTADLDLIVALLLRGMWALELAAERPG